MTGHDIKYDTGPDAGPDAVHDAGHHAVPVRTNMLVWAALMLLTAITVGVTSFDFGFLNVVVALSVATTKAGLVILWFMHLRYEGRVIRLMVFTAFVILAIAIGLTFFDVAYR
ncbi:cytochrome-c oxidase [Desulfovibrio oxamicus]|uniref:Cytochrome-c oxidase n=1 Tax=Nitratidesulfovibrio oxamicus TaxID=32016 RepID=A0ABS0J7K4_9BACT|nr:cytochrome C oxidase subunit IV family protein [Nitratidesulfovibrio oxamicus]MBG3878354.1 cytochrome-c oxidase [Nitratidesulfovibrio oxamicus]